MAYKSVKKDIDRIYQRIDKIAKGGRDNYLEYYEFVDDCVRDSRYALLEQTIYYKYKHQELNTRSVKEFKDKSWFIILEGTLPKLQTDKSKLFKDNKIYNVGVNYFLELDQTSAKIIDSIGKGAILSTKVVNGSLVQIDVINSGIGYSTASSVEILGGYGNTASGYPIVRAGKIYQINIISDGGNNHNKEYLLGKIFEENYYIDGINDIVTSDDYQKVIKNKKTFLTVEKVGITQSVVFNDWDITSSYDRNVMILYNKAVNYLI